MKPFNLERALAGEPVVTRDGRPVKIAGYNPDAKPQWKLAAWVDGNLDAWYTDGTQTGKSNMPTDSDLRMAPNERKEWIVLLRNPSAYIDAYILGPYRTFEAAKDSYNTRCEGWASIHEITIHE
jgi:hypothetical protein